MLNKLDLHWLEFGLGRVNTRRIEDLKAAYFRRRQQHPFTTGEEEFNLSNCGKILEFIAPVSLKPNP